MLSALVAAAALILVSPDFRAGGTIPAALRAQACGGANRLPALRWSAPPPNTRSFAIVLHDPDAPVAGGFYHWVLYDIPATARSTDGASGGGRSGIATTGQAAYFGPCPPPGPAHHYIFTLYALDVEKLAGGSPTGPELQSRVRGHVLARATLEATARTP